MGVESVHHLLVLNNCREFTRKSLFHDDTNVTQIRRLDFMSDKKSHLLLDAIAREFRLKNDSALADFLGDTRPSISIIRSGKKPIPDSFVLKAHKATGWPVLTIESLIEAQASR